MKKTITLLAALAIGGMALPVASWADEDKGKEHKAAEQAQTAEAMLEALLAKGMPADKALKKVLKKFPDAPAAPLIARAVQAAQAQGGKHGKDPIEAVVKAAAEVLGEDGDNAITQGLLLAGVDPEPYAEATAAGKKKHKKKKKKEKEDEGGDDNGGDNGGGDHGGLPGGGNTGGGGGGGGVSPS